MDKTAYLAGYLGKFAQNKIDDLEEQVYEYVAQAMPDPWPYKTPPMPFPPPAAEDIAQAAYSVRKYDEWQESMRTKPPLVKPKNPSEDKTGKSFTADPEQLVPGGFKRSRPTTFKELLEERNNPFKPKQSPPQ